MSGPASIGRVHSFVLFLPPGAEPPPLPWAGQLHEDSPKVARWIRLSGECHGDGKPMQRELYTLVVDGREADDVIDAFHTELKLEQACDEAVLLVNRHPQDDVELYTRNGAPLLAAALRSSSTPSLVGSPPIDGERALRELVDRKLKVRR